MESSLKKKVQFLESEREREETLSVGTPTSVGHQSTTRHWATTTQLLARTKEVSSHKWINELMTNFVHRKAHAACSNLHSGLPARLIVSLSHIKEMVQFFFKKKKGSILRVILKKKDQFLESYWKNQFFESFLGHVKKRSNSLSHVKKKVQFLGSCKKRFNSWTHLRKRFDALRHIRKRFNSLRPF